jgi:hypothetical protein
VQNGEICRVKRGSYALPILPDHIVGHKETS